LESILPVCQQRDSGPGMVKCVGPTRCLMRPCAKPITGSLFVAQGCGLVRRGRIARARRRLQVHQWTTHMKPLGRQRPPSTTSITPHTQVTSAHTHTPTHPISVYTVMSFCTSYRLIRTHPFNTHPFNGPFSGTTQVSRYQKGKTNLHFTEARDSEWQWHQLGHMQVCT